MIRTSTVLYSDKEVNEFMREQCAEVVAAGGSFSITHRYTQNWFADYVISFPDELEYTND